MPELNKYFGYQIFDTTTLWVSKACYHREENEMLTAHLITTSILFAENIIVVSDSRNLALIGRWTMFLGQ